MGRLREIMGRLRVGYGSLSYGLELCFFSFVVTGKVVVITACYGYVQKKPNFFSIGYGQLWVILFKQQR